MKLLSVAIPCYNSEAYMSKCINSLLIGGEEVEIIIVDDGSSDRTAEIADDYAEKYPTIVKAIHQENGGHGQAVNTGIKNATGLYFKVVDSDDWVNQDAYYEVLKTLYELTRGAETVDLLISNFVYEKQGATRKKIMQYRHCFPTNQIFGWDEVRHMKKGQYLLMHSMIYRTKLLHDCGMELPKHTFYVDNLFAFEPLPYVKNLYYLDVNFYRYFIGRDDQSVNEKVMIKRIDQQIRVNKLMVDAYLKANVSNRRLRAYMFSYLDIITTVSSIMLVRAATQECLDKKQELPDYILSLIHISSITYTFGDETVTLDGSTIKNWLQFDEKGQLIQDDASFKQHIVDYVAQLAADHDTVGTERQFQTTSGRTVSVSGSAYGWKIDQDGEVAQLTQEIQSGAQTTREPVYSMRANSYGVNDLGNTYIEVDLTEQYMWYYQDGNVIFESDIVSGLASDPKRKTPPGIFTLYYKKSPDVLRGTKKPDGTYSYEQPVTYWMPFNGGIGFHDADWQPYFGGDRYLTGGSHGCINMPPDKAGELYNIIQYNVPIVCFY